MLWRIWTVIQCSESISECQILRSDVCQWYSRHLIFRFFHRDSESKFLNNSRSSAPSEFWFVYSKFSQFNSSSEKRSERRRWSIATGLCCHRRSSSGAASPPSDSLEYSSLVPRFELSIRRYSEKWKLQIDLGWDDDSWFDQCSLLILAMYH